MRESGENEREGEREREERGARPHHFPTHPQVPSLDDFQLRRVQENLPILKRGRQALFVGDGARPLPRSRCALRVRVLNHDESARPTRKRAQRGAKFGRSRRLGISPSRPEL